jgi:hypothetical protein
VALFLATISSISCPQSLCEHLKKSEVFWPTLAVKSKMCFPLLRFYHYNGRLPSGCVTTFMVTVCKSLSDASLPKWSQNKLTFRDADKQNQTNISNINFLHRSIMPFIFATPCHNGPPKCVSTCAAPNQSAHCPACYCQAVLFAPADVDSPKNSYGWCYILRRFVILFGYFWIVLAIQKAGGNGEIHLNSPFLEKPTVVAFRVEPCRTKPRKSWCSHCQTDLDAEGMPEHQYRTLR